MAKRTSKGKRRGGEMVYERELHFLCDVLKKSHVRTSIIRADMSREALLDMGLEELLGISVPKKDSHLQRIGGLAPQTVYCSQDAFSCCYRYFLLPDCAVPTVLYIGPYLSTPLSSAKTLEIGEKQGISPKTQKHLDEYYASLPILSQENSLFLMIHTFCERIWNNEAFSVVEVGVNDPASLLSVNGGAVSDGADDALVKIKTMEKRYEYENEMMQAVSRGQIHKEGQILSVFSEQMFEKRVSDPLRNAKNYSIIMNTLLRKAAEGSGVHPVYLDQVSSEFAAKIEALPSWTEHSLLMRDMFRSYCRLVRKHSMRDFSLVVQKAMLLIDSDFSSNLSLAVIAEKLNVSGGYLATVFKRETGKTVSQYIREQRVQYAIHLLSTTHLQIQTVALHCGMMDVQYFSKIFKKETGKTPREYRESLRNFQR